MKNLLLFLLTSCQLRAMCQQTFSVTEETPVVVDGLKASYTITDESEKEVGKKGDFSRFKIKFSLTNTGFDSKIMYKKPGFMGHLGPLSPIIALFKCTNATGARMTNKMASMELQPCKIEATLEDAEPGTGKIIKSTRLVDIGFWIKPGETVSKSYPMIVPLGTRPSITITFYPEPANQTGTFINNNNEAIEEAPAQPQEFVRLKNNGSSNYLHNQDGPLACTTIDFQWWSAQWEIIPVNDGKFQIRNRWKNNFISTANSEMLSDDGNASGAYWVIEETGTPNTYYIRNVANNAKLIFQTGQLKTTNSYNSNDSLAQWIIEK